MRTPRGILLVCRSDEVAADVVVLALTRGGVPFVRVNLDRLSSHAKMSWTLEDSSIAVRGAPFELTEIRAVWCRRLRRGGPAGSRDAGALHVYAAAETEAAFCGILETAPIARWMNRPSASACAENKLLQLRCAAELGFTIPETLVSNDPVRIRAFAATRTVVAKPVHAGRLRAGEVDKLVFARAIGDFATIDDPALEASPAIYQSRVAKAYDVRVTVVGARVFGTRILAPNEPPDWRAASSADVRYDAYDVPAELAERCRALVRRLGLAYGAIDLVVAASGETYFLEINPGGQWAWLERATGQPITEAIVEELTS